MSKASTTASVDALDATAEPVPAKPKRQARNQHTPKPPGYIPPPKRPRNRRANRGYQADTDGNLPPAAKTDTSLSGTRNRVNIGKALKMRLENGNSLSEIAAYFGVTKGAVSAALKPFSGMVEKAEAIRAYANNRSDVLDAAQYAAMTQFLDPVRLEKMSSRDAAISYGVLYDKGRLEKGQSTQNLAITGVIGVLDEVSRAIEELSADDVSSPETPQ